jgi:hypothetical protein
MHFGVNYDYLNKDNMRERIEKALNHLLKLYGATVYKEDTF